MWPLVTYSNYFKSSTFYSHKPDSFEICLCLTLILYHCTVKNDYSYVHGIIFAAPGFWILEYVNLLHLFSMGTIVNCDIFWGQF